MEHTAEAVENLVGAAQTQRVQNVVAHTGRAEKRVPELLEGLRPEVVVLDPPRKGMGAALSSALGRSSVKRVVLISCQPESLCTDVPPLLAGGFSVERVSAVEQFPRTGHVETVLVMRRG